MATDDFTQSAFIDMGIDLRRRDIAVPEQFLDDAEVGTAREQVGREAVAKHVRMHMMQTRPASTSSDDLPDRDTLQRSTGGREQQMAVVPPGAVRNEFLVQPFQIAFDRVLCRGADGHDSLFAALPVHEQYAERLVVVANLERTDFARAQARGIHQLKHRSIARPEPTAFRRRRVQQLLHLDRRQHIRKLAPARWRFEQSRRIVIDLIVGLEESKEHAHRGEMARDRTGLQTAFAVESTEMISQQARCDIREARDAVLDAIRLQVAEVTTVRLTCGQRHAGLDPQIREEVTNRSLEGGVGVHWR